MLYIKFADTDELIQSAMEVSGETQETLLILMAEKELTSVEPMLESLKSKGVTAYGAIFPGLMADGEPQDNGAIIMPVKSESGPLIAQLDGAKDEMWTERFKDREWPEYQARKELTAMVYVDCNAAGINSFLTAIFDQFGDSATYFGAGTGFSDLADKPSIFGPEGFVRHAALVLFCQTKGKVQAKHGYKSIKGPFVATKTGPNQIQEINWEPAGDVYGKLIAEEMEIFNEQKIFPDVNMRFPFSIVAGERETVIRDIIGINDKKALLCISDVPENAVMHLAKGDAESVLTAGKEAAKACVGKMEKENEIKNSVCLISDCYSRVLFLDKRFEEEIKTVESILKRYDSDVFVAGVMAIGEIASDGKTPVELLNKTFVVGWFHE